MAYQSASGGAASGSGPYTSDITVTAGSDRVGILFFFSESTDSGGLVDPSAGIGVTPLTLLGTTISNLSGSYYMNCAAFWASESVLATVGTGTKTAGFTATSGIGQGRGIGYIQFSGRSQSTPTATFGASVANGTAISVSVSASASGADLCGFAAANTPATFTLGGDLATNVYSASPAGDDTGSGDYAANLSSGSKSAAWTLSAERNWAAVAIIMEAAGGGSIVPQAMAQYINQVIQ